MKVYNTIFAVPGWMFGTDLKLVEVNVNDDNSVLIRYDTCIGWMAKKAIKTLEFKTFEDFKNELDFKVTVYYCNKFLNQQQRNELNYLLSSGVDKKEVSKKAFKYAKMMLKLKYERNLFNQH
jgi:hypothetical protein